MKKQIKIFLILVLIMCLSFSVLSLGSFAADETESAEGGISPQYITVNVTRVVYYYPDNLANFYPPERIYWSEDMGGNGLFTGYLYLDFHRPLGDAMVAQYSGTLKGQP